MPLGFLVIWVVSLMTQGAVGRDAGLRRRDPQAARQDGSRRKDDLIGIVASDAERGPSGPRFFLRLSSLRLAQAPPLCSGCRSWPCSACAIQLLTYWYYHLPNFVLAALMYTLLGRVAARPVRRRRIRPNYIWRFFCRITDPVVGVVALVTPKAAAPVVVWLFGFVWLFWLRVLLLYGLLMAGAGPQHRAEPPWTATSTTSASPSSA